SKRSQPLSASQGKKEAPAAVPAGAAAPAGAAPVAQQEMFPGTRRRRLPETRNSVTHKFSIASHEGYITVGMYDDGAPGEIFIKMSKEGSTLSGFMDGFAMAVSIGLQYGVPLKSLVDKFINTRFDPSGYTANPEIRYAKSVLDYIGRWLGGRFISRDYLNTVPPVENGEHGGTHAAMVLPTAATGSATPQTAAASPYAEDAPTCSNCGSLMTRNGSCYKCGNCGETSGCS